MTSAPVKSNVDSTGDVCESAQAKDGLLLVGYGGPESLEAVGPFMKSLMGREPSPELLARVEAHYSHIGGKSPLVTIARAIAASLGERFPAASIEVGMVHTAPFVDDALDALVAAGCTRIILLSLSPFYSTSSNGASIEAVRTSARAYRNLELVVAPVIGEFSGFVVAHGSALAAALTGIEPGTPVAFSAHSLPMPDVEAGDHVYVEGLRTAANAVAQTLSLAPADEEGFLIGEELAYGTVEGPYPWAVVFQSQGLRGDRWLQPTLKDFLLEVAAADFKEVVVCPLGFATEHMETLYDLDIVTAKAATEAGLAFVRSAAPNSSESLIDAYVDAVNAAQ